jgi:hypothetical protein
MHIYNIYCIFMLVNKNIYEINKEFSQIATDYIIKVKKKKNRLRNLLSGLMNMHVLSIFFLLHFKAFIAFFV